MKTFTALFFLFCSGSAMAQQYCMLPGRTSYSVQQPGIVHFKLNTIDRTSLQVEGPLSVPSVTITGDTTYLVRGQSYTVTIEHTKDPVFFPNARNNIRVWVDYNANFSFTDAGETVISKDFEPAGTFTGTFTVPMDAPIGLTRLRATAKMSSDAGHTAPTPCDEPKDPLDYHGEMEDYMVYIQAPAGVAPQSGRDIAAIYPNPVTKDFTVRLSGESKDVSIELFDMAGRKNAMLYQGSPAPSGTYHFDMDNYVSAPGIYYIKITAAGSSSFQKIIKSE